MYKVRYYRSAARRFPRFPEGAPKVPPKVPKGSPKVPKGPRKNDAAEKCWCRWGAASSGTLSASGGASGTFSFSRIHAVWRSLAGLGSLSAPCSMRIQYARGSLSMLGEFFLENIIRIEFQYVHEQNIRNVVNKKWQFFEKKVPRLFRGWGTFILGVTESALHHISKKIF